MLYLTLTLGGTVYKQPMVELFKLTIGESRAVERETGLLITEWIDSLSKKGINSPKVLATAVYILKTRAGETVSWADIDKLSLEEISEHLKMIEEPEPVVVEGEVVITSVVTDIALPDETKPTVRKARKVAS